MVEAKDGTESRTTLVSGKTREEQLGLSNPLHPQRGTRVRRSVAALVTFIVAILLTASPASARQPCESLGNGRQIGNAIILVAKSVAAGDYTDNERNTLKDLPAFCRIFALTRPHPSSRVLVEIWLPEGAAWNGKLFGTGNGGEAGKISTGSLAGALKRGYAAANTDLGTYPAGQSGVGFRFGDGSPEMIRDWAFRGTHEMTVLAKEIVTLYYGKPASKSYFAGCSTGGHQALMEAQRYPDDYDAIIAGAPAHNRTRLHTRFAALRLLGREADAALPYPFMQTWRAAMLKACAGRDGGAPGDSFLTDPFQCNFAPSRLACKAGDAKDGCFSEVQARALGKIYDGTRNPRTGEMIYFGDLRGSESQLMMVYGEALFSGNFDMTNWILPSERDYTSFDFDRDMATLDDTWAAEVNAMNPDLSRFAARGGKLILFHGWEDGLITATDSIDYFQRIRADGKRRDDFVRLFLVPGMGHCVGGPGPSIFGQLAEVPLPSTPSADNDLIIALDRWAKGGAAPESITGRGMRKPASSPEASGDPLYATRPICAFPSAARYDGKGDPMRGSSFTCARAPLPEYERPAAPYLR